MYAESGIARLRIACEDRPAVSPVQELTGAGVPQANHLSGLHADEIFAVTDSAGTRSLLTDALGSTIAVADSAGVLQGQYTYEPFGKLTHSGTAISGYQFTGRETDGTGLQFNRARYYSPDFGRFISEDPLGSAAGDLNLYAYVGNSPLNAVDPSGMISIAVPLPGGLGGFGAKAGWAGVFYTAGYIGGTAARKHFGGGFGSGVPFGEHGAASSPHDYSRSASGDESPSAAEGEAEGDPAPWGSTPKGRPYTKHYGEETGPERNIPGSVVDDVIDNNIPKVDTDGASVYYDPDNNVTVVWGRDGIVSVRKGPPKASLR